MRTKEMAPGCVFGSSGSDAGKMRFPIEKRAFLQHETGSGMPKKRSFI
jgi:hypothetical protein